MLGLEPYQITEILLVVIGVLVAINVVVKSRDRNMSEELKKAISNLVEDEINKAMAKAGLRQKSETQSQPKTEVIQPVPQELQKPQTISTPTVRQYVQSALDISRGIDTDADSRPDIFKKLSRLEENLKAALKEIDSGGE